MGGNPRSGQWSAARMVLHGLLFAALWAILSGGKGWAFGIPVVLLAATASCVLVPKTRLSLDGLVRFVPYFAWNSLRGGIDVASRAVHPHMPIDPALLRYELQLDDPVGRVVMANVVTLLPGTLSADLQGNVLLVHVLNAGGPFPEAFQLLEGRVADLFGRQDSGRTS